MYFYTLNTNPWLELVSITLIFIYGRIRSENLKIFMFFEVRKKMWRDGPILTADLESGGKITMDIIYRMHGIWPFLLCVCDNLK